ncbi:hypothetical protein DXG01_008379 [Tephrocybe rancida]|nr:hypothetical protein DXG01_008379 [Tephrocybe rancida]
MSSLECSDELAAIQSIYSDILSSLSEMQFKFSCPPIVLSFYVPLSYPNCPSSDLNISIDSDGLGVSRAQMSGLKLRLAGIVNSKPGEAVLFELLEETREYAGGLRTDAKEEIEEAVAAGADIQEIYFDMDSADRRVTDQAIVDAYMGSTTIQDITDALPSTTKLLHAEVVLRDDLRQKYLHARQRIQEAVAGAFSERREKDAAWDRAGQEEIVFHGTPRHSVASIVRSGFVIPGQNTQRGEAVEVRDGTTWGYADTTEDGQYEGQRRILPGYKLVRSLHDTFAPVHDRHPKIVSVITMGRRFHIDDSWLRGTKTLIPGYDSHVSPGSLEYIVFDPAQVLPLYVLHLGEGKADVARPSESLVANSHNMTEYARKHFPLGFGGGRFVVEAIAPVDDDEELWGENQYDGDEESVDRGLTGEFQNERWMYRTNIYR